MADQYNDRYRPTFPGIVAAIQRYDPRLFIRFNRSEGLIELWRWLPQHVIPRCPDGHDIRLKAAKQFEVLPEEFDHRFPRMLYMNDLARFDESMDPDKIADAMDAIDTARNVRDDQEVESVATDWMDDNKKQINKELWGEYAGYYPTDAEIEESK